MSESRVKRLYLDDSTTNPAANLGPLKQQLHAAYTHWVRSGTLPRDFSAGAAHAAALLFFDFLMAGSEVDETAAPVFSQ